MTIIDEIITIANQLANEGKQPSVALVKTKLTKSVPLPTLIKTLKGWQHDPDFTATTPSSDEKNTDNTLTKDEIDKKLTVALTPVMAELKEIKELLHKIIEKH